MKNILILFLLFLPVLGIANEIPPGWKITSPDQYSNEDVKWFKGILPNKINSDFNGDKIPDTAWLLTNSKKTKLALFVSLSKNNNTHKTIKLFEDDIIGNIYVGISNLPSGKHKTACGKGYWQCSGDEPPTLNTTYSGIVFFKFESASSVFIWEQTKFKRVWLSD